MRHRIGELWIGLGIVHFVVVAAGTWGVITDIVGDGYVNAIGSDYQRNAVFWLFYLGCPCIIVGVLARWAQRRVGTLPQSAGWTAAALFLLGALAVPTSGFWLGVLLSVYMIVVARRDARDNARRVTTSTAPSGSDAPAGSNASAGR